METQDVICQFINDELLFGDGLHLTTETQLLDEGILDSLGMLRMVEFLERHFAIKVAAEEINRKNFRSVHSLASFVEDKAA